MRRSIAIARRDFAGDLRALLKVAADGEVGGRRAGAVGLKIGPVAAVEMGDELGAPLPRWRFGVEQRLHLGAPLVALIGAADAAQVLQAAEDLGKPFKARLERRNRLGGRGWC